MKKQITYNEYFYNKNEEIPNWISYFNSNDTFDINEVLKHNILYYPGSFTDGQPISVFNKTHSVHTYIYVDYFYKKDLLKDKLSEENCFNGYHLIGMKELSYSDLAPMNFHSSIRLTKEQEENLRQFEYRINEVPFALLSVFERNSNLDGSHGAKRFGVIFICGDGYVTYEALFVRRKIAPKVLVLVDHGFGGNFDRWGKDGLLEHIAMGNLPFPDYLFCQENTIPWLLYTRIPKLMPSAVSGKNGYKRWLYEFSWF